MITHEWCGINKDNAWSNILSYSILTQQSLDYAASAAGRIDTEAARYLRIAQNMVRTRIDIIIKEAAYGPIKKVDKKNVGIRVSRNPIEPFMDLWLLCSDDKMEIAKNDNLNNDLENVFVMADGTQAKIEGALLSNLAQIIKTESELYTIPTAALVEVVENSQRDKIRDLQGASIVVADFIRRAIELLKDKVANYPGLHVCTSCGTLYSAPVEEKCETCGAGSALVVAYPFPPKGDVAEIDKRIHERPASK